MSVHYSPDMGGYEHKGNKYYFESGIVTDDTALMCLRSMPSDHGIEYSTWSDAQRKLELKKRAKIEKESNKEHRAMLREAKKVIAKLTKAEDQLLIEFGLEL